MEKIEALARKINPALLAQLDERRREKGEKESEKAA
jgi:hypothetical protein